MKKGNGNDKGKLKSKAKPVKPAPRRTSLASNPPLEDLLAAVADAAEAVDVADSDRATTLAAVDGAVTAYNSARETYRNNPTLANANAWLALADDLTTAEAADADAAQAQREARAELSAANQALQAELASRLLGQ